MNVYRWHLWFAWYPVKIDAYRAEEIRKGAMRYRVWARWIECRARIGEDGRKIWDYRLPQPANRTA